MENKKKIINDPVHGFIPIPNSLIYDLIQHPYFQRLSRIKQLGMSYMVYPGAVHTRFLLGVRRPQHPRAWSAPERRRTCPLDPC